MRRLRAALALDAGRGWDAAFGVSLALAVVVLGVGLEAFDPYRWSGWDFGDAQTMMSSRQWNQEGWIHDKLMFVPQGWAPGIELVDDPPLRQHAHGICSTCAPSVGPRRLYNHAPSAYLLPYALLYRLGLTGTTPARTLAIAFSLLAVVLFYLALRRITGPAHAFFTCAFYLASPYWLHYAWSLANQPLDDVFRFGFVLSTVLATRAAEPRHRRQALVVAWVLELVLALVSFDSAFFLPVWLFGWLLLERRRVEWRILLVFALAPILGFGVQYLQNAWYLGFRDAYVDYAEILHIRRHGDMGLADKCGAVVRAVVAALESLYGAPWIALGLGAYVAWARRGARPRGVPSPAVPVLLLAAGAAFSVVLSEAMSMQYEPRQLLPFCAALAGAVVTALVALAADAARARIVRAAAAALAVAVLALVVGAGRGHESSRDWKSADTDLSEAIARLGTRHPPMVLELGAYTVYWTEDYFRGFAQIHPVVEYYASAPILSFPSPQTLVRDLGYFVGHSKDRFSPVLVTKSPEEAVLVRDLLAWSRVANVAPGRQPTPVAGRYVLDLTDAVRWDRGRAPVDVGARDPLRPRRRNARGGIWLEDYGWEGSRTGRGSIEIGELRFGGRSFQHGVRLRAPGSVIVALARRCTNVRAIVGLDDAGERRGPVTLAFVADGESIWRSPRLDEATAPLPVDLDLAGRTSLTIQLLGDRGTVDLADADLLCDDAGAHPAKSPLRPNPHGAFWLGDLAWLGSRGAHEVEIDTSRGQPIRIRGRRYRHGVGTHAPTTIEVPLTQGCYRFRAQVGIDDGTAPAGSAIFHVYADGEEIWRSVLLTGFSPPERVDLDVSGRSFLRLEADNGDDGPQGDWVDWGGAELQCSEPRP
jgi:hypothetical protein